MQVTLLLRLKSGIKSETEISEVCDKFLVFWTQTNKTNQKCHISDLPLLEMEFNKIVINISLWFFVKLQPYPGSWSIFAEHFLTVYSTILMFMGLSFCPQSHLTSLWLSSENRSNNHIMQVVQNRKDLLVELSKRTTAGQQSVVTKVNFIWDNSSPDFQILVLH